MRIKLVTVSSKGLDTPIRFPSPVQPALKNSGDIRLDTEKNEVDELALDTKLLDQQKEINFGNRKLF
jgi:hypothetical protein